MGKVREYLISIHRNEIIDKLQWSLLINKYDFLVSDKDDLPHICSYFVGNCNWFVTTNRKLTQQEVKKMVNFITPKRIVEILKIKSIETVNEI